MKTPFPLPAATPGQPSGTRWPQTSAVLAGWVCVGAGLLTAWIFPPAYVFFSVGMVLSVVAMATHQVREGLLLLVGSLVGIGVSALLLVFGLAALLFQTAKHLPEIKPLPTPNLATRRAPTPPPVAQTPDLVTITAPAATPRPIPLTLGEVSAMLSVGRSDDEIIAVAEGRAMFGQLGASELATLRSYGTSDRLINYLCSRMNPVPVNRTAPIPRIAVPVVASPAPPAATPTPIDYAARDRRIADLKRRMEEIDETLRRVRADPHWYGMVKRSTDTSRQQASDEYLKALDKERNDLRRQVWDLEGR